MPCFSFDVRYFLVLQITALSVCYFHTSYYGSSVLYHPSVARTPTMTYLLRAPLCSSVLDSRRAFHALWRKSRLSILGRTSIPSESKGQKQSHKLTTFLPPITSNSTSVDDLLRWRGGRSPGFGLALPPTHSLKTPHKRFAPTRTPKTFACDFEPFQHCCCHMQPFCTHPNSMCLSTSRTISMLVSKRGGPEHLYLVTLLQLLHKTHFDLYEAPETLVSDRTSLKPPTQRTSKEKLNPTYSIEPAYKRLEFCACPIL